MEKCRIIRATRKNFLVLLNNNEVAEAVLRGKAIQKKTIKVGDWVDVEILSSENNKTAIKKIYKRKSSLVRGRGYKTHTIVANVDQLLILMSAKSPDFRNALLDRYLLIAERNKIPAIICLNKIDLVDTSEFDKIKAYYDKIDYRFIYTSAKSEVGLKDLQSVLSEKTTVLIGHSGVGKSSLIKKIEPGLNIKTQEISEKSGKGKHTTTHSQLYPLAIGGSVIDTPGIKELGIGDILKKELKQYFKEFIHYEDYCKFNDCYHIQEPGCAIIEAVEKGEILKARHQSYVKIYDDLAKFGYEWDQGKVAPV